MVDSYFTQQPSVASDEATFELDLPGRTIDMVTDTGVFSRGHLDKGTRVLLQHGPDPAPAGDLLDLGCGYGPIALVLAAARPSSRVWGVDVNERALELTRRNAAVAGVAVRACRPDQVPDDVRFAEIWSNPPIRSGKEALHELLRTWLPRLDDGGRALLVVSKNLGSDSLARWLIEQGWPTRRLASHAGFRVLSVTSASAR